VRHPRLCAFTRIKVHTRRGVRLVKTHPSLSKAVASQGIVQGGDVVHRARRVSERSRRAWSLKTSAAAVAMREAREICIVCSFERSKSRATYLTARVARSQFEVFVRLSVRREEGEGARCAMSCVFLSIKARDAIRSKRRREVPGSLLSLITHGLGARRRCTSLAGVRLHRQESCVNPPSAQNSCASLRTRRQR
jgi:hypothetical protein